MATPLSDEPQARVGEVIDRLEALLCQVAGGALPNRAEANVYQGCRSDLLQSAIHDLLPGFLYQCPTIFKFKDFITLYDPDAALREAFVGRTFARCRTMWENNATDVGAGPAARPALDSRRWMS